MFKLRKNYFNLIEIAMALGIIGFGVASVMSVFPAALQNANNSIGENYASNAAELFFSFLNAEAKKQPDWDGVNNILGDGDDKSYNTNWSVISSLSTAKDGSDDRALGQSQDLNNNGGVENSEKDQHLTRLGGSGSIYLVRSWSDKNNNNTIDTGEAVDFEAAVRVWRASSAQYFETGGEAAIKSMEFYGNGSWIDITPDSDFNGKFGSFASLVYVELSWPFHKPYDKREKRVYSQEFFNPWSLNQ